MTLWTWVDDAAATLRAEGHPLLAESVARLPRAAAEGDLARIRADLPAALSAAAGVRDHPWIEGYLRHWPGAARVGAQMEGATALAGAQARLRAAHGNGSSSGCAPAACAAENVLACYANIDGPGTVVERASVLAEAAGHCTPGEPRFEALAVARADLLIDDERPDEAIRHLDAEAQRVRATGADVGLYYGFGYVRALRAQDRHTDALHALEHLEGNGVAGWAQGVPRADAHRRIRFERARLLAWSARAGLRTAKEAVAALPDVREAESAPFLRPAWAEAVEHLIAKGAVRNDWRVGVTFTGWARHLEQVGAHRPCLDLSLTAARLAAQRGAHWVAAGAAERAERMLAQVRRGEDPRADLAEVRADMAAMPPVVLPGPAAELLDVLSAEPPEEVDPERHADLIRAGLAERPDDTGLLAALGRTSRVLHLGDAAAVPQWDMVRRAPGDRSAALALLDTLLHDNDQAGVRTLVRTLTGAPKQQSQPA
ncbi:hypothetical protein CLV63_101209 [Murinocardiopsis flavida]|uniref:Uncharacterized protein n=1 Tax=Murinocardiopsis flavida TaxID=645275 RepID=A0A2P8DU51_9ACTN|nr:hypothetical protein [Murinocardiopsis flavida]PSL00735.1 hypothetical protein CLV63_101209 [Murinocardiopsis flavida]